MYRVFLFSLTMMAGRHSILACALVLYAQYVPGQVTTSASAVAPTFSGQTVPAYVYPSLPVTGQFSWYVP